MNLHLKKILTVALLVVVGALGYLNSVQALTISPPLIDSEANPGSIIQGTIKLTNDTSETAQFFSSINRFEAKGEQGEPQIITEEDERIGLVNWIDITPGPVELSPGQTRHIPLSINIPKDAEPGGHYAVIFWGTKSPEIEDSETAIGIESKVGVLVLLTVGGEIVENGRILEFDTVGSKHLFSHLPIGFYLRFQNDGTIHIVPQGEIHIKDIFGREVDKRLINEKGGSVLPSSVRRFETTWNKQNVPAFSSAEGFFSKLKREWNNFALGRYTANLDLMYGYGGSNMVSTNSVFWVVPWRIIVITIILFAILALILRTGIKRYNRWIIKRHHKARITE